MNLIFLLNRSRKIVQLEKARSRRKIKKEKRKNQLISFALINLPLNANLKHDPPPPRLRAELTFYSDEFPSDVWKTARIDR